MEYPFARELWTGGRKRTLRKRTRRGGQMYPYTLAGGRNRTRRGGQIQVIELYGGRKRTRRGGQIHRATIQIAGGRKRTRRGGQGLQVPIILL